MIINIRGTHGSGKTTLVRAVMEEYRTIIPIMRQGRRNPIGYKCSRPQNGPRSDRLFIAGSYVPGTASGGCDTISDVATMYGLIRKYAKRGYHVVFEGILAQHSTPNIIKLFDERFRVRVIVLDIPLKKAIRSVKRRRKVAGNTKPFNPVNTEREIKTVRSTTARLAEHGVKIIHARTRRVARARVFRLLGLEP